MREVKLELHEVLALNEEIKELTKESLPYTVKYKLNRLAVTTAAEVLLYQTTLRDLLEKLGVEGEGNTHTIEPDSENYKKFEEEIYKILSQEVVISAPEFPIEDFSEVKSELNFAVFSKLH